MKYNLKIGKDIGFIGEISSELLEDLDFNFKNASIFEIDYKALYKRIEPFKEQLIAKCFHPDRLVRYLEKYNYDIGDEEYLPFD